MCVCMHVCIYIYILTISIFRNMYVYVFIQAYTYICIDICIRSETIGLKNLKISGLDGHRDLEHVLGRNG